LEAAIQVVEDVISTKFDPVSHSALLSIALCRISGIHSMTLGNVYDLDLKKNESKIKGVIIQAQGEVCSLLLSFVHLTHWCIDGSGGVHQASQGSLDQLHS
jgi:hypothetical protein